MGYTYNSKTNKTCITVSIYSSTACIVLDGLYNTNTGISYQVVGTGTYIATCTGFASAKANSSTYSPGSSYSNYSVPTPTAYVYSSYYYSSTSCTSYSYSSYYKTKQCQTLSKGNLTGLLGLFALVLVPIFFCCMFCYCLKRRQD